MTQAYGIICLYRLQGEMVTVIILNSGSMFASQWREFSPPLSSAHRLLQCYHRQKRDWRRCNSRGIPPQPPATRVISQWASILEWRHAVMLHILDEKICISFFLFYCESMLSLVVLWLCGEDGLYKNRLKYLFTRIMNTISLKIPQQNWLKLY